MLYFILSIFALLLLGFAWFIYHTPKLPTNIDTLITEVINEELPELMPGKKGFAQNGGISICYEVLNNGQPPKSTILMIMGHSQTMLGWSPYFLNALINSGYQLIRYDNRGLGESDWLTNWHRKTNNYTLEDMATDGIAILDALGIQKAHLIGSSMGGMIAQRIAISHSERVLSLTSIMSTGYYYDPQLPHVPRPFLSDIVRLMLFYGTPKALLKIENKLKLQLGIRLILEGKGDYTLDPKYTLQRAWYEIKNRKGFNGKVGDQHGYAIKKSGSRYAELPTIKVPTLVIHGTDDPLVSFEHAQKYAPMIPHSTTLFLKGMGHDMPEAYNTAIVEAIVKLLIKVKVTERHYQH